MDTSAAKSINDRVMVHKKAGVDFQRIDAPNYLYIHIAAQAVLQKRMPLQDIAATMLFLKAEDGPYKYLVNHKWDGQAAVKALMTAPDTLPPIHKLRGSERPHVRPLDVKTLLDRHAALVVPQL